MADHDDCKQPIYNTNEQEHEECKPNQTSDKTNDYHNANANIIDGLLNSTDLESDDASPFGQTSRSQNHDKVHEGEAETDTRCATDLEYQDDKLQKDEMCESMETDGKIYSREVVTVDCANDDVDQNILMAKKWRNPCRPLSDIPEEPSLQETSNQRPSQIITVFPLDDPDSLPKNIPDEKRVSFEESAGDGSTELGDDSMTVEQNSNSIMRDKPASPVDHGLKQPNFDNMETTTNNTTDCPDPDPGSKPTTGKTANGHHVTFAESHATTVISDPESYRGTTSEEECSHPTSGHLNHTSSKANTASRTAPANDCSPPAEVIPVPIMRIHRTRSVESQENPFVAGGELDQKAEFILRHSTISRTEVRIADPDSKQPVEEIPLDEVKPVEAATVASSAPPTSAAPPAGGDQPDGPNKLKNGKVEEPLQPQDVEVDVAKANATQPQTQEPEQVKTKDGKKCKCCVIQ